MIFQEPMTSFSPVHTIGNQIIETIILHQDVTKRKRREARPSNLLRVVGIPKPRPARGRISSPIQRWHAPAGHDRHGLACNPSLLIADEPTTALDVTTQAQILELMRGMQNGWAWGSC